MIIKDLDGLVFNSFNYKENDLIVDVLTSEYGFIQLYVKGGQKLTSKSFYLFKMFNQIKFDLSRLDLEGISMYKSGAITYIFDYTKLNYIEMNSVMLLSELLLKVKKNREYNLKKYYDNVLGVINDLNKEKKHSAYFNVNYFLYLTLQMLGCAPVLDSCYNCSKTKMIVAFDNTNKGFVCQECLDSENDNQSDKNFMNYLYAMVNYHESINDIVIHKRVFELLINILSDNTGVYLVSQQYLY